MRSKCKVILRLFSLEYLLNSLANGVYIFFSSRNEQANALIVTAFTQPFNNLLLIIIKYFYY